MYIFQIISEFGPYYSPCVNLLDRSPWTSKTGFGQVTIMKEFVWINIIFFLNFAFGQVGEKKFIAKTAITIDIAAISQTFYNINTLLDLFTNVVGDTSQNIKR